MPNLVADCPRCGAKKMTFEVTGSAQTGFYFSLKVYEVFAVCRNCKKPTIYEITQLKSSNPDFLKKYGVEKIEGSLNQVFTIGGHVIFHHEATEPPPKHLPEHIEGAFREAATCVTVQCWNAAGVMFRKCVDLSTKTLLPEGEIQGLSAHTRRNLASRLEWLFDNGHLAEELRELSTCIREDGNDGAHAETLTKEDALDLHDFTLALLERIFTLPERVRLAGERRENRRSATES